MKRRHRGDATLTPEVLAGVFAGAQERHGDDRGAVLAVLAEYGVDHVDAIRARRWLRHGRPASWHPFAFRTHIRGLMTADDSELVGLEAPLDDWGSGGTA